MTPPTEEAPRRRTTPRKKETYRRKLQSRHSHQRKKTPWKGISYSHTQYPRRIQQLFQRAQSRDRNTILKHALQSTNRPGQEIVSWPPRLTANMLGKHMPLLGGSAAIFAGACCVLFVGCCVLLVWFFCWLSDLECSSSDIYIFWAKCQKRVLAWCLLFSNFDRTTKGRCGVSSLYMALTTSTHSGVSQSGSSIIFINSSIPSAFARGN